MPKELLSTITSKGQVTIPATVRQHLGVHAQQTIAFVIDPEGNVHLTLPQYPRIAALRGAAGTLPSPLSPTEIDSLVDDEHGEDMQHKTACGQSTS